MINRRLIAAQHSIANDERLEMRVQAYHDKCLREAHYKHVIEPQIEPDSQLVKKVSGFSRERRKIKHLFAETKAMADSLYRLLKIGEPWDKLAGEVFNEPGLAKSGGDLGWVYWDQLEFDMAMRAFELQAGRFSGPVRSRFGWHILYVEDFEIIPLKNWREMRARERDFRLLTEKQIGDKIAADYINKIMDNITIEVRPKMMKLAGQQLKKILRCPPNPFDRMKMQQLTDAEQLQLERTLWDYRNETLAIIDGKPLTIAEFIGLINYIPYQALHHSFKTALDFAFRDFVITKEAKQMNLSDRYPFVAQRTRIFREYLVQLKAKQKIVQQTKITDKEINNYFDKNKAATAASHDNTETRKQIKAMLLKNKQRRTVSTYIEELRAPYEIEKNLQPIHEYYNQLIQ